MYDRLTVVERMECRRIAQRMEPCYRAMGWLWGGGARAHHPSEGEIESTLCELADMALKNMEEGNGRAYCSSGGFTVEAVAADPTCDEGDPSNPDNHLRINVRFNP